jgi:hypothetical protein
MLERKRQTIIDGSHFDRDHSLFGLTHNSLHFANIIIIAVVLAIVGCFTRVGFVDG